MMFLLLNRDFCRRVFFLLANQTSFRTLATECTKITEPCSSQHIRSNPSSALHKNSRFLSVALVFDAITTTKSRSFSHIFFCTLNDIMVIATAALRLQLSLFPIDPLTCCTNKIKDYPMFYRVDGSNNTTN